MKSYRSIIAGITLGLGLMATATTLQATPVGLELLLLQDVSGSMDGTDFSLARGGYVNAFKDPSVQAAIGGISDGIAVSLVYWSDSQAVAVPWTHITDAASSNAFADAIAAAGRPSSGSTAMTAALTYGTGLFDNNGFEGLRKTIDLGGDGAESVACAFSDPSCTPLQQARDAALLKSININALWIEDEQQPSTRTFFCLDASCTINPLAYGSTNVIGGAGSFQVVAGTFADFERAAILKIGKEIQGIPEPGSLALMVLGFAAMAGVRKRPIN